MPDSLIDQASGRRRSKAWIYYALLTLGSLIGMFTHAILILGVLLFGLYTAYLYRGGRFVIWFW